MIYISDHIAPIGTYVVLFNVLIPASNTREYSSLPIILNNILIIYF